MLLVRGLLVRSSKVNNYYNPVNLHDFFKIERRHATRRFSSALFRVLLGFIGPLYRCINCICKILLKICWNLTLRSVRCLRCLTRIHASQESKDLCGLHCRVTVYGCKTVALLPSESGCHENSDPENSDPLKFKIFSILIT